MSGASQVKKDLGCNVAIIGGGFSGSMLAAQLLRIAGRNFSVVLVERGPVPGPGLAFGTQFEGNLLNVPAKNMSAYPDDPDHFWRWAQRNYKRSVKPDDFLPRALYGQYVASQLREASRSSSGKLQCIQDEATSLARVDGKAVLHLASGQTVVADKVVLALGNFPPGELSLAGKTPDCTRYVANPWSSGASLDVIQQNGVLLVGSGLTSVDVAMELRARGFQGAIHILSRRGLLPQSHKATISCPTIWSHSSPRTVRGLLREVRLQIRTAEARGSDWRAVIDSLRPVTQQIWRTLPQAEQRRFLRHVRAYWDVHRHRIAERVADRLALEVRNGRIRVLAGRITQYREDADGVEITYRERKSGEKVALRVDRVVNCTGPAIDYRQVASPLLSDLLHKKLARPDQLSLGLDVSSDGALLDPQGRPSDFLYALGPLRKESLWETTAVPEIRVQVSQMAKLLAGDHLEDALATAAMATPKVSTSSSSFRIPKETSYA
ncbi:MAG TPA: FAD/NAD(P)-binding protein [Candidatus Sulfotelmatobacter sp.]|nr:FAD/NAD(P)-binding protein [Candidatus Sulfotelmatobacter sp.]